MLLSKPAIWYNCYSKEKGELYIMKKLATGLVCLLATMTLVACGEKKVDYSQYITTLPEYKEIPVTVEAVNVTEEEITAHIDGLLQGASEEKEVTGRAVQEADTVNINYVGKMDGVEFEGGTAENFDLKIGSGQFIEGFETGLIGANQGDTLDVNVTFPDNYTNPDYSNKPAVFTVTINTIKETVIPELTEEIVPTIAEGVMTIEALKQQVKELLTEQETQNHTNNIQAKVFEQVYTNTVLSSVPQDLVDYYKEQNVSQVEAYATQFGVSIEEYVEAVGQTMDEFNAKAQELAEGAAKENVIIRTIADKEKIKVSKKEIEDFATEGLASAGVETIDEYFALIPREEVDFYLTAQKVLTKLGELAVVTEE